MTEWKILEMKVRFYPDHFAVTNEVLKEALERIRVALKENK